MAHKYIYLTPQGLKKLEDELELLRSVKRHEVAQRLHEAIEEGGELEENAAYEVAKTEQAFLEGRIREIEEKLGQAIVIEPSAPTDEAQIGSTVIVQENGGNPEAYTIVGASEAKPKEGLISYQSPLGQALLNKHAGEEVFVKAPAGELRFRIIKVN
ncbi:MAG: transcription elongation factor GreA [Anaerolineae bacterium SM23_ 63]|nr:MAG: transcription elongation factor GreA [Anaerolineae bacterium SM23_ 63]HEY46429.1 transcription elongation factor GreA [Anaerolineae bacterium]